MKVKIKVVGNMNKFIEDCQCLIDVVGAKYLIIDNVEWVKTTE